MPDDRLSDRLGGSKSRLGRRKKLAKVTSPGPIYFKTKKIDKNTRKLLLSQLRQPPPPRRKGAAFTRKHQNYKQERSTGGFLEHGSRVPRVFGETR